jgi:cobalamin biosynthesis Mg chelatase CobN
MSGCASSRNIRDWLRATSRQRITRESGMPDLIWIIVIVLVVLLLLGYFGRGRFGR